MNIKDILKLNNEIESLNIIQDFLSRSVSHNDFEIAICMYLKISFYNNQPKLVLEEGNKALDKIIDKEPTKYREQIYSYLIDSAISLKLFKEASKYIIARQQLLPIMKQYLTLLDELNLAKAKNDETIEILIKLKNEVIPLDINILVLEEILEYYLSIKDYNLASDTINDLMGLALNQKYEKKLIEIKFYQNLYEDVIELAPIYFDKFEKSGEIAVYYISSLIKLDKLRNASSLEAEYEELIDNIENEDLKRFAYETMIHLYTLLQNHLSINLYTKKIEKLSKKEKKTIEPQKVIEKEVIKIKKVATQTLVSNAKYLEHFEWVLKWLLESHDINLKLVFREYLREFFIKINSKVEIKEAILYIDDIYESNFYNFKKDRLYDKKVINEYIEGTLIKETLNKKENMMGEPSKLLNKKDVLTQKDYEDNISYIYSFYINNKTVLLFYIEDKLEDPSIYYELFNGIANIIHTRVIDEKNVLRLQSDARSLESILNNEIIATRKLTKYTSVYNNVASKLFNIDSKYHLELFLRQIPLDQAREYEKKINRLFTYPNESTTLEYEYNNLNIKEYLFAIKENGKVVIISYFINISSFKDNEVLLLNKANICNESKLPNKNQFLDDLSAIMKNKVTFVLIELNQELSSIYGNTKLNKLFIEFILATKLHFYTQRVYRYDYNQVLVILDYNDIRSVNKELNNYFQVVNHLSSKVLKYEKYNAKAGVLRYPVTTIDKNIERLFNYIDVSLQKAKNSIDVDYVHFIQSDYEKEIFEQEVIDYLNTAIENKQLSIKFNQITDIVNNLVWNHESTIYLPNINISNKYLYIIAKKRKKLVDLEYYHIEAVCSFLEKLQLETNRLIKITIPISKETLISSDFSSYLFSTLKRYKIPAEFIRILVELNETSQSDDYRITNMIKSGISVDTTNVESILNNDFNAVHLKANVLNTKSKNYYKDIHKYLNEQQVALVIRNVNTKEMRETLKHIGINYIQGDVYQKIEPSDIIAKIKGVMNENN